MKASTPSAIRAVAKQFPGLKQFLKEVDYGTAVVQVDKAPIKFFESVNFKLEDFEGMYVGDSFECSFFNKENKFIGKVSRIPRSLNWFNPIKWFTDEYYYSPETVMMALERFGSSATYAIIGRSPNPAIFFAPEGWNLLAWGKKVVQEADEQEELIVATELKEVTKIS